MNLFPELVESGQNASKGSRWVLYRTPGRQLFCALSDGTVVRRNHMVFGQAPSGGLVPLAIFVGEKPADWPCVTECCCW